MIHLYECSDGSTTYHEIYVEDYPDALNYCRTLENEKELDLYLDILSAKGIDFVLHTLKEYDEYHVALPSV